VDRLSTGSKWLTKMVGADSPRVFLPVALVFTVVCVGGYLAVAIQGAEWWDLIAGGLADHRWSAVRMLTALLIALAGLATIITRRWTTQIIALAVCGFLICFYFVLYRAPDLALTQILIETVTLVLLLYLLGRFPKSAQLGEVEDQRSIGRNLVAAGVAIGVGAMVTGLGLLVTANPNPEPMGGFFLAQTAPLAGGTNAVNTILVDFRGFDTLCEITVLGIAMVGALGLMMRKRRSREEFRQGPLGPPGIGIHFPWPEVKLSESRGGAEESEVWAGPEPRRSPILASVARGAFFC
jgi:multisubunit Na+/H+ antiporter MnhB subunit